MRVHNLKTLRDFWTKHADAAAPLQAWYKDAEAATWASPADVKARYASVSILDDGCLCFNIKGNKYRLIVSVKYEFHVLYIRFLGTHAEYSEIDAKAVCS